MFNSTSTKKSTSVKAGAKSSVTQIRQTSKSKEGPSVDAQFTRNVCNPAGPFGEFAAERIAAEGGAAIRKWNGQFWEYISRDEMIAKASDWLDAWHEYAATQSKAEACADYAETRLRSQCPLPVRSEDDAVVLAVPGAYLTVNPNGGVTASAPDKSLGLTHSIRINVPGITVGQAYIPKPLPDDSRLSRFLCHVLPRPEVRAFVQEQCAASLLPESLSHCAWWTGIGGDGKSTLLELIREISSKPVAYSLGQLGKQFGLEALVAASHILVDETKRGTLGDEGEFKTLVSGGGVLVTRKNKPALVDYRNRAMIFVASNNAPFFVDKSDGCWRRMGVVKFENPIPKSERIPDFHKVLLREEGHLWFDWLLEGLQRIVARGRRFLPEEDWPASIRQAQGQMRTNGDSILGWIEDCGVHATPGKFGRSRPEVYECYARFCEEKAIEPLSNAQFFSQLESSTAAVYDGKDSQSKPSGWIAPFLRMRDGRPFPERPRFIALDWTGSPRAAGKPSVASMHPAELGVMLTSPGKDFIPCDDPNSPDGIPF